MFLEGDKLFSANDVMSQARFIAQGKCALIHPKGMEFPVKTYSVVGEEMLISPAGN